VQYWYRNYVALHRLPNYRPSLTTEASSSLSPSSFPILDESIQSITSTNKKESAVQSETKSHPKELQVRILNLDGALLFQTQLIGNQ
jgi:hypothetical protein